VGISSYVSDKNAPIDKLESRRDEKNIGCVLTGMGDGRALHSISSMVKNNIYKILLYIFSILETESILKIYLI